MGEWSVMARAERTPRVVMWGYARRDLTRNPRRTLASVVGVALGVGLFSAVLLFIDTSAATMTQRAIAPLTLDMQRVLASPYARHLHLDATIAGSGALPAGSEAEVTL